MEKRKLRIYASFIELTAEDLKVDPGCERSWDQIYDDYPNFRFKVQHFEEHATPQWSDDWEEAAGGFAESIKAMGLYFAWAVAGRFKDGFKVPFFDWLACDKCEEVRMCPRSAGAPSANVKCGMTHNCDGVMKRLPDVYEVIIKAPPKKKPASTRRKRDPNSVPGVRGRKGYSKEVREEAYRLKSTGMTTSDVARQLARTFPDQRPGISTVRGWLEAQKHKEPESGNNAS
jgi:hypothetical protein